MAAVTHKSSNTVIFTSSNTVEIYGAISHPEFAASVATPNFEIPYRRGIGRLPSLEIAHGLGIDYEPSDIPYFISAHVSTSFQMPYQWGIGKQPSKELAYGLGSYISGVVPKIVWQMGLKIYQNIRSRR